MAFRFGEKHFYIEKRRKLCYNKLRKAVSVMWKTKRIETKLNEKQFLDRLKTFCRDKTRFDKGYNDKDVFVVKRNRSKFWLCKHYAHVGKTDGYANDCIYFQYIVNKNGYIDIEYRFGKRLLFLIPFIICFTAGIVLWTTLVYDAIAFDNVQWGGLCVTALFWIFGLVGMLFRSRKERVLLEKHLLRICSIKS